MKLWRRVFQERRTVLLPLVVVLVALTVFVGGVLFWALESQRRNGVTETLQFLISWAAASAIFAGGVLGRAWWNGPTEICDTVWACLDVNRPAPESQEAP